MAKRRNENGQMRREEYEAADDDVSADSFEIGFQRASEDSIRKRKIVKARVGNRPPVAKPKAAEAGDDAAKSNPFGGFQGLTATKPAASNPFAGFSGLTKVKPATETSVTSSGSSVTVSGSYQQAMEGLNKAFLAFVNGQSQKNPCASWEASIQDYLKYATEIATKHASTKPVAINETKRAAPTPFSFGTTPAPAASSPAPALSSSSSSFGGAKKNENEPAKPSTSSGFSFGGASKKSDDEPVKSSSSGGFSFGGSSKKDDEPAKSPAKPASGGFSFGGGSSLFSSKPSDSEEKTTPAFSFGALPKPAASAASSTPVTGGFSFGNTTAPKSVTPASTGGFSFGASAPSTSTSAAAGDEDEENIGREEATVIIKADSPDDDCTFEADKAKIFEFKKDEKRWADKGVHPLKVLVSKETKSARILVRNEIGKIVLNSALYKGMAVRPHEVKGKKTGVTLALQVEGGELTQFLLKVNAARVDAFIKALEAGASSS
ncbi:Hypothetical protein PHPALM_18299 [Phytophthora palmivora]|uniref:RanBD1 domain-containing protein n=1 Tax=Phytophthora palmivora TaxID=4796 RepID=A0A2P4XK29_9STRA|nr:Hypothetical protein PHPALM_18299 [Phytophthora palmivora]